MTEWRPRGKSRWTIMVAVAAVAASVALPATARAAAPTRAAGATEFSSSFESTDQQPDWINTVETDAAGNKKADGVDGALTTGVPGSIMDNVVGVGASDENTGGGEIKENLIDGDPMTKWLTFQNTGWVEYTLSKPIAVVDYWMTSANDHPQRDPKDWTLQGSVDGQNWTVLDTRTGETFPNRFQSKEYQFSNTTPYLYYKLDITLNGGEDIVQLADLALSNGDTTPPPPSDMKSQVGTGPTSSPTAKARAGFTGLKALQYAGRHLNTGRAYSYNKVYETHLAVTRDTELSYKIFPELLNNDLNYPSTYASVDLAFTDGTYLSDLGAVDQQFVKLDPQSQGRSKTLYTNQWNHKWSRIGDVAAGKTIARILVAYDNPTGPATFRGWIDDLRISGHAVAEAPAPKHLSDNVLTTRGTNASGSFSRGNNFPATAVPHGFNFWTPETNAGSQSWLYEYAHANNDNNLPVLQAFAASHEPSPWMGDRQTFQVMPSAATGVPSADRSARGLPFSHADETARPYYYSVTAQNKLKTEIAPTDHAAMFRFTFPTADANLIFDNVNNNGGLVLNPLADSISGYSDVKSGLSTGAGRLFVYATFDRPVSASGMLPGGGGANVTGYYRFRLLADRQVTMRIATSLISVEQAKHNLELEIAPRDQFDTVKDKAQKLWDDKLGIITVQGSNADQRATLYSNLYRLFLYPNSGFENTGSASRPVYDYASAFSPPVGPDTPDHTGAKIVAGKDYVNNGFWDTYRTTWPAYSLLTPTEAGEMIDGFVQQYKDGGWIARWSSPGYANLMTGTSSDVAFADAYLKGVKFDVQAAYQAALKNATVTPPNDNVGRKGLASSVFLGYTPTTTGEGMSWAMEGYVNDFGIANMAKALGDQDNYNYFLNRAQNYVNMFDPSVGFFQGRNPDGGFRLPASSYDPRVWGYDYTETDGWNMAFTVPQDGQGLANLYGGKAQLAQKLDTYFATPETAAFPGSYGGTIHEMIEARDVRMGQYGHSNQPSHHILYMYDYAGQPSKTQAKVREALSRLYAGSDIGQGYPGDEDNGEMSAWEIFSALGFYPLQMGSPYYAVGSPLFTKATVHLENGKELVVNAPKNSPRNVYVQGLKVNGQRYDKTYLPHSLLAKGATLDFDMGPAPSKWGTGTDDAPQSITKGDQVAKPLRDVTGGAGFAASSSDGTDVTGLFDNTSNTRVTFTAGTPSVRYQLGTAQKVTMYTLTSGAVAGDATAWTLEGSTDGTTWTALDRRAGQTFPSRLQTRAFSVTKPGTYQYYRLTLTATTGTPSLAELELLANP